MEELYISLSIRSLIGLTGLTFHWLIQNHLQLLRIDVFILIPIQKGINKVSGISSKNEIYTVLQRQKNLVPKRAYHFWNNILHFLHIFHFCSLKMPAAV